MAAAMLIRGVRNGLQIERGEIFSLSAAQHQFTQGFILNGKWDDHNGFKLEAREQRTDMSERCFVPRSAGRRAVAFRLPVIGGTEGCAVQCEGAQPDSKIPL